MTANRIGYRHLTKQLYTKEAAKRSDIVITSTISMSLFPKDQRMIEQHMRVFMDMDQTCTYTHLPIASSTPQTDVELYARVHVTWCTSIPIHTHVLLHAHTLPRIKQREARAYA